jgi:hypothetical protein
MIITNLLQSWIARSLLWTLLELISGSFVLNIDSI